MFLRWLLARLNERYMSNRKQVVDAYLVVWSILTVILLFIMMLTFDNKGLEGFSGFYLITAAVWLIITIPLILHYLILAYLFLKKKITLISNDYNYYKENYGNLKDWSDKE